MNTINITANGRKAKMKIRIFRAKTGRWEKPSLYWHLKNIARNLIQKLN